MRVGDLVKLSAYGRKRKRAEWINPSDIGLIIKVIKYKQPWPDDYVVCWTKSDISNLRRWAHERANTRRDLAYVK